MKRASQNPDVGERGPWITGSSYNPVIAAGRRSPVSHSKTKNPAFDRIDAMQRRLHDNQQILEMIELTCVSYADLHRNESTTVLEGIAVLSRHMAESVKDTYSELQELADDLLPVAKTGGAR